MVVLSFMDIIVFDSLDSEHLFLLLSNQPKQMNEYRSWQVLLHHFKSKMLCLLSK